MQSDQRSSVQTKWQSDQIVESGGPRVVLAAVEALENPPLALDRRQVGDVFVETRVRVVDDEADAVGLGRRHKALMRDAALQRGLVWGSSGGGPKERRENAMDRMRAK